MDRALASSDHNDTRGLIVMATPNISQRRLPYRITVRHMATGCDYTKTLFLRRSEDAFETMARHVRWLDGIPQKQLRLISVEQDGQR